MNRRAFIAGIGSAAAWPVVARAQQGPIRRRIIVLIGTPNDAEAKTRVASLNHGLEGLGWVLGRNIQIDYRFADAAAGNVEQVRAFAKEAVATRPDLIVAHSNPVLRALYTETPSQPIVFLNVSDPVGEGFVQNLAHPGSNTTGFTNFEPEIGSKWLQILKESAPALKRVGFVLHPETSAHAEFLQTAQTASTILNMNVTPLGVHDAQEIDRTITEFGSTTSGGLIVAPHPILRGKLIPGLTARYGLPAIYPFKFYALDGGLVTYGIDQLDQWARAATYVDRILRGTRPADLPVQQPTKYELVINLKTAKALGLDIPPSLLARADEVIE
jgi:putative ABC transport system substrate-binding protein